MPSPSDPERIGRYHVLARIGRGGMGTVYRARDPHIGRTVAIKVLHVSDEEIRSRFAQEVRSAGTLKHPNIVTIHDYGEDGGEPFMVMEYIEGRTLADLLRDPLPMPLAERLRLMRQLCSALGYAHDCGVIHRDIKPANLMVDGDGSLKVLDFGVARVADSELTRVGVVLGTLKYMSPEQIDGVTVDRRADIFSVGVVLYEVLSSHEAFPGDTASSVMRAVLNEQPPALTERCPDLDPDLDRIVATALQKDPAKRYATLAQLGQELAAVEARLGPGAAETIVIDRSARDPRSTSAPAGHVAASARPATASTRTPAVIAIALVLVASLALGAAGALVMRHWTAAAGDGDIGRAAKTLQQPIDNGRGGATNTTPIPVAAPPPPQPPVAAATGVRTRTRPIETGTGPPGAGGTSLDHLTRGAGADSRSGGGPAKRSPYDEAKELLSAGTDPSRLQRAAELLQEACDRDASSGCVELAQMFVRATGVAKDDARAASLYRRACDVGQGAACNEAGLLYRDSTTVRNMPEAIPLFQRACDNGGPQGCNNLAIVYARGAAVTRDDAKAASLFQRACDGAVAPACDSLARAYQQGLGVVRDDARARTLFERGCDAGGSGACVDLGVALVQGIGGGRDEPRAVTLFQHACDGGNYVGCANLGLAYARGTAVPRDDVRAASLYERACSAGGAPACGSLAFMYSNGRGVPRDDARAAALFQKSCDGNVANSCDELSRRYTQGQGVERNQARAAELARRATLLRGGNATTAPPPSGVVGGVVGGLPAGGERGLAPPPAPPPPSGPVRVGGNIKQPVKTRDVRPVYPPIARSADVRGVVIVEATIGPNGKIVDAKVLRSIPLLDQAALDAVKQWEFAPTLVDGVPRSVVMTVTVNFSQQ